MHLKRGSGKRLFLFFILVLAIFALMKSTGLVEGEKPPLERAFRDLAAPLQRFSVSVTRWVENAFAVPFNLFRATQQNEQLTKEIQELKNQLQGYEECRQENERLKKLLDFQTKSQNAWKLTAAAVIGRDPGNWFRTVTIDKGSRQGIKEGMPVLVPEGLVGRIVSVTANTSEVMLISDPRSAVSGLIQETRSPGIVEGTADPSGLIRMIHIPYDVFVRNGQTVITSGLGSFYPKGIAIGKITDARKDPTGLFYVATVQPFIDFNRLEEVLVLVAASEAGR